MAISTRIESLQRDIDLIVKDTLSPQARSAMVAQFARTVRDEAKAANARVLGREPPLKTFVDGSEGASEESVRPDGGTIVYEFLIVTEALQYISDLLTESSPVGSGSDPHPGLYKRSHTLFADGVEVSLASAPPAQEYVFLNLTDYARKLEQSYRAVYQSAASMAAARYGNIAKIAFSFREPIGAMAGGSAAGVKRRSFRGSKRSMVGGVSADNRTPAIVVTLR